MPALFRLSVKAQIVHFTFKTLAATIQTEIEFPIPHAANVLHCILAKENKIEIKEL